MESELFLHGLVWLFKVLDMQFSSRQLRLFLQKLRQCWMQQPGVIRFYLQKTRATGIRLGNSRVMHISMSQSALVGIFLTVFYARRQGIPVTMCLPAMAKTDEVTADVQYAVEEVRSRLAQKLAELLEVMKVETASPTVIPKSSIQFKPSYAPAVARLFNTLMVRCAVAVPPTLRTELVRIIGEPLGVPRLKDLCIRTVRQSLFTVQMSTNCLALDHENYASLRGRPVHGELQLCPFSAANLPGYVVRQLDCWDLLDALKNVLFQFATETGIRARKFERFFRRLCEAI